MKYISNCSHIIDWDLVIKGLESKPGKPLYYNDQSFDRTLPGFDVLASKWEQAFKYNDPAIEWINYFPMSDFDEEILTKFQNYVNAKPFMVWISKIKPGRMAPWHFDAHSKINELKLLNSVRYTCYIQKPSHGHISIVENTAIYMPKQGDIYQWPSHDSYHCGMNGGFTDKYMFNYWGYLDPIL